LLDHFSCCTFGCSGLPGSPGGVSVHSRGSRMHGISMIFTTRPIAWEPMQRRRAVETALPDEPAEIGMTALRLSALGAEGWIERHDRTHGCSSTPSFLVAASCSASQARGPLAKSDVPCAGDFPGFPVELMNRIFGATNRIRSAVGANLCHQGHDVRCGTRRSPSGWQKNFSSHGTSPPRRPNGAFIQMNPLHGWLRLSRSMKPAAGIHGVMCWPGLATSRSKEQPRLV